MIFLFCPYSVMGFKFKNTELYALQKLVQKSQTMLSMLLTQREKQIFAKNKHNFYQGHQWRHCKNLITEW